MIKRNRRIIEERLSSLKETEIMYLRYRVVVRDIINAYNNGMPFIPFSQWTKYLDGPVYAEKDTEENLIMRDKLKNDLSLLASTLHYTGIDRNGFMISDLFFKNIEKTENFDENESLTVGELIEVLNKYPANMKIKLESDSYEFNSDFHITSAFPDKDECVVLYGN